MTEITVFRALLTLKCFPDEALLDNMINYHQDKEFQNHKICGRKIKDSGLSNALSSLAAMLLNSSEDDC